MRALRKIIFINSAHIRFAEIRLDGNVHFIGTQGVGKSTLLRAILFFYNAEKLHLGIPREMKPFDEFYLPHANSYIVYEVEHEHGPFSILVNRSSYGRASYRFIDSAFHKEWLIDEFGEVTAEQTTINARLGKSDWSRVEDYSTYRDIIYGNHKSGNKKFSRYQLMETQNYQNIYRSIQNVFLNSRLDANFIKDIIIRSMNEVEANINLGYYRNQVADFEQEYKDISCWYKTNQKGESPVRVQADKVIETYRNLLYLKTQINNLCGELNYAIRMSKERMPLLEEKAAQLTEKKERQERLLGELNGKYKDDHSKLDQSLGEVNGNIRKCKEKKGHYSHLGIEYIIKRCEHENVLKVQLEALQQQLNHLTEKYSDITIKYKQLSDVEVLRFETFRQAQQQRKLELKEEAVTDQEKLAADRDKKKQEIDNMFEEKLATVNNLIESIKKEKNECENSLFALKYFNPYTHQIDDLKKSLQELRTSEKTLYSEISAKSAEINRLLAEFEKQEAMILAEYDPKQNTKTVVINEIEAKIAELDNLLEKTKGSLYEWLESNVAGWEQNIGKVIDEQGVLYQTGLRPQKSQTEDTSLFGVSINLSDLPMSVRNPDELKAQKAELEREMSVLKNDRLKLEKQKETALEALKKHFTTKIKALQEKRGIQEAELQTLPNRIKAIEVQIHNYEEMTNTEKDAKQKELDTRLLDIAHRLTEVTDKQKRIQADKHKQIEAINKAYATSKTEIDSRLKEATNKINLDIEHHEDIKDTNLHLLKQRELDELKGKGADTNAVDNYKHQIDEIKDELEFIEKNRKLVYNYRQDKEELFDHEAEFKSQKKLLVEKLEQLSNKYEIRRQEHAKRIAVFNNEINTLKDEEKKLQDGLTSADQFIGDTNFCPPMLQDAKERKTLDSPENVVNELKSTIISLQKLQNDFRQSINVFKANFSAKNTFNFRTLLNTDEDYLDFASNLDDFILNNKIEDYRSRVNERYIEILRRVSKEMGDLTRYESEIDKIIKDINSDFREKNFVGVIKLIALQMKHSSDPMVVLMKRIKDFHDENRDELGEVTLFTTSKRDDMNRKAVEYILDFMKSLNESANRQSLTLSDLFQLEFRVVENDNDTGWVAKISHVGSEGTDTLVKAMVNIMLINVFKEKVSKKFGDFQIHCMMDEIGKLHPQNVKGILEFANSRNILLINSSPITHNVSDYRYTYLLEKDTKSNTIVHPLISQK